MNGPSYRVPLTYNDTMKSSPPPINGQVSLRSSPFSQATRMLYHALWPRVSPSLVRVHTMLRGCTLTRF